MPTALGAMARLGGCRPGETVVVQGSGPVGLSTTLLASLNFGSAGHRHWRPGESADRGQSLGATIVLPLDGTSVEQRRAQVLDLTDGGGAEIVVECTGRMEAFDEGMGLLAEGGRYGVVGIYSGTGTVALDPVRLNNHNLAVIGSMGPATLADYRTTIQLAGATGMTSDSPISSRTASAWPSWSEAVGVARRGEAIKVIIQPSLDA